MNADQIITILSNLVTGGGVVFFLGMWIRALKNQISEMNKTIEVQQKTLEAMKTQVSETEKIGSMYRKLFEELPTEVEKWKVAILKLKDERIEELEKANQAKDEKLTKTVEIEIEKLNLQQQAIEDIPQLREELIEIVTTLEQRLSIVNVLAMATPLTPSLAYMSDATMGAFANPLLVRSPLYPSFASLAAKIEEKHDEMVEQQEKAAAQNE